MGYMPIDDFDFDTLPIEKSNWEITIHVMFMEPLVFTLDSIELFLMIKDIRENKLLPIDNTLINPKHIKLIEFHKMEEQHELIN